MIHVVSETNREGAEVLLSQGIVPGFKRKIDVEVFAPGRGLDRKNLYVMSDNVTDRGSYGPVRLHLNIDFDDLAVSPEQKRLGVTDVMTALNTMDGAVTQGRQPPSVFKYADVSSNGSWKRLRPREFLAREVPVLPTPREYGRGIEARADEWFLSPRKVRDLVADYAVASLDDKINLAREAELIEAMVGFELPRDIHLAESDGTVSSIKQAMKGLTPSVDHYGQVWFNPGSGELRYALSDSDEQSRYDEWDAAFKKIDGVKKIDGDAEVGAPKDPGWIDLGRVRTESLTEGRFDFVRRAVVPPAPGKSRIPANHVRLFHYTRVEAADDYSKHRAAEALRRGGIDVRKAKGSTYGEPNQVWSSTKPPHEKKVFAEFSVPFDDERMNNGRGQPNAQTLQRSGWDVTFWKSIQPSEIIAVHEPWHFRYRYIKENPRVLREVIDGEFDDLLDDREYGPAVAKVKMEAGQLVEGREELDNIIDISSSNGNWNYDAYMHGMANGLLLGRHVAFDEEGTPEFHEAPDKWLADCSFESQVEAIFDRKQRQRRQADRDRSRIGRYATRDYKQAQGHRRGQRQRSQRISRVSEREQPYGAKSKGELPKQPPKKLWHVTLFPKRILRDGFKTRSMLGNRLSVLGGGSDDSVSFTDDRKNADMYARGLRMAIESLNPRFDPYNHQPWQDLAKKYGFPVQPMINAVNQKVSEALRRNWDHEKTTFEVLQDYSFLTRTFPLFMGGGWPKSLLRASPQDVAVLEIDSSGPQWWDYKPGEKEFRVFDVENIGKAKRVS